MSLPGRIFSILILAGLLRKSMGSLGMKPIARLGASNKIKVLLLSMASSIGRLSIGLQTRTTTSHPFLTRCRPIRLFRRLRRSSVVCEKRIWVANCNVSPSREARTEAIQLLCAERHRMKWPDRTYCDTGLFRFLENEAWGSTDEEPNSFSDCRNHHHFICVRWRNGNERWSWRIGRCRTEHCRRWKARIWECQRKKSNRR